MLACDTVNQARVFVYPPPPPGGGDKLYFSDSVILLTVSANFFGSKLFTMLKSVMNTGFMGSITCVS